LISVGFVTPARGPRREYRFSFQDLIVLRAARALIQAKIPRRRIHRSLQNLRKHLPETMPLSGLSICAVGDRVVVRDGGDRWHVDSGQYLLGIDVSLENGVLHVVEHKKEPPQPSPGPEPRNAEHWFSQALELEDTEPRSALRAYEQAATADPENIAVWINWGRLLHEQGKIHEAEKVYRRGLEQGGPDPLLLFNLGVLLEDLGKTSAAIDAYLSALAEDPDLADGHYNLARLYEAQGQPQHAIRHLGQYRRLVTHEGH
jgi:tetratricopeptide (TPR) repeat protein